jgi:hypothetical protein
MVGVRYSTLLHLPPFRFHLCRSFTTLILAVRRPNHSAILHIKIKTCSEPFELHVHKKFRHVFEKIKNTNSPF